MKQEIRGPDCGEPTKEEKDEIRNLTGYSEIFLDDDKLPKEEPDPVIIG